MTIPGVGPVTTLAYIATIDDPGRFASSKALGAHLGLTPRVYQSGEIDRSGQISKCGDRMLLSGVSPLDGLPHDGVRGTGRPS
jgi:transposase